MVADAKSTDPDVPKPSPELSVVGVVIDVLLDEMPRRQRERMVRRVAQQLEWLSDNGDVVRLRSPRMDREAVAAHRAALAWWRSLEAVWLNRPR